MAGPNINKLVEAVTDAQGRMSSKSAKVVSGAKRVIKQAKKVSKKVKARKYETPKVVTKHKTKGRRVKQGTKATGIGYGKKSKGKG
jgi:hypothetical protein